MRERRGRRRQREEGGSEGGEVSGTSFACSLLSSYLHFPCEESDIRTVSEMSPRALTIEGRSSRGLSRRCSSGRRVSLVASSSSPSLLLVRSYKMKLGAYTITIDQPLEEHQVEVEREGEVGGKTSCWVASEEGKVSLLAPVPLVRVAWINRPDSISLVIMWSIDSPELQAQGRTSHWGDEARYFVQGPPRRIEDDSGELPALPPRSTRLIYTLAS